MKQYLKLLMAREAKEVLGKGGTNLWLLTIVLVATFASIAFSEGSMIYLRDKMEDPFTNWVSITKGNVTDTIFNAFRDSLHLDKNKKMFEYQDVLMDHYLGLKIQGRENGPRDYLIIRFFEHFHTPIVNRILDADNVVDGCQVDSAIFIDKSFGFIVTLDAMERLGYDSNHLPAYIHMLSAVKEEHVYDLDLDSLGLNPIASGKSKFVRLALPVLAVVRKLPNNMDMVSSNFFYEQYLYNDITCPFSVTDHESDYLHHLIYWVSDEVGQDAFENFVRQQANQEKEITVSPAEEGSLAMKSWKSGKMLMVDVGGEQLPIEMFNTVDKAIVRHWDESLVQRVYLLESLDRPSPRSDYLSVEFRSLQHIREFEAFAKNYGISLEMEQVHSKENFNAVTVIARVLSTAMVTFAIICIIMFLVNMLQSYFQKVRRNIGTFKAFGMNTKELIQAYVLILVIIVCSAVVMALLITWCIQGLLPVLGIEKEGFNYLALWNSRTYVAATIVFVSTILTVSVVMSRMLSKTPGDLIYDR